MNPYLAMIFLFGGNFAPSGFATCDGQILSINQNTALFSLLGTTYGGNGQTTFALPDLRGRVPNHMGQGPGLSPYVEGQAGGAESITLTVSQMPGHNHVFNVNKEAGTSATPGSATYLAAGPVTGSGPNASSLKAYTTNPHDAVLASAAIGSTGGGQPFNNLTPYLTLNYVIALQGIYPSRN